MGTHVPKPILDEAPPMIVGGSLGAVAGWLIGSPSKSSSFWPVLFLVICIVSLIAWYRRSAINEKEDAQRQKAADESDRKLDFVFNIVASQPDLIVASGNEAPRNVGDSATVPPGATIVVAVGAGPVKVTIPSNGLLGLSPMTMIDVIIPEGVQSFRLPEGGTVTAFLSGVVRSVSTVKGQPTAGPVKEEEGE